MPRKLWVAGAGIFALAIPDTGADSRVTIANMTPTAQPGVNRLVSFGVDAGHAHAERVDVEFLTDRR